MNAQPNTHRLVLRRARRAASGGGRRGMSDTEPCQAVIAVFSYGAERCLRPSVTYVECADYWCSAVHPACEEHSTNLEQEDPDRTCAVVQPPMQPGAQAEPASVQHERRSDA